MSENERWLYEETDKDEKVKRSQPSVIIPLKRESIYSFVGGRDEIVDLSKIGVNGLCCPHIRNVLGADVLKYCEIQPIIHQTRDGVKKSYAKCGPLGYINHFKKCPFKGRLEDKKIIDTGAKNES